MIAGNPEPSSQVQEVRCPADIDISAHAVIEASAGTGKTYTISGLVLRLVGEEAVSLRQVLVVTFTEKATGELKQRIRTDMEDALKKGRFQWAEKFGDKGPPGWKQRFREAIETFQDARIFTIHGFCQRSLADYAMEANSAFDLTLIDDREVFERCLNRLKRRWALNQDTAEQFSLSGYQAQRWDQALTLLAGRYHPDFSVLRPEPMSDESIRDHFQRVLEIVRPEAGLPPEEQPFWAMYQGLEFNKRSRGAVLQKVVRPLLGCLCAYQLNKYASPVSCVVDIEDQCMELGYGRFKKEGFFCIVPASWNKGADQSAGPLLHELGRLLDVLCSQRFVFLVRAVKRLYLDALDYKDEHGLMSFSDMICRLYRGLDPDQNPNAHSLCSELRQVYRFCLVDEAQDTDPVQAAIFQRIFLDESATSGCRLFVIGDPKQAIYGFRGADVNAYLAMKARMRQCGARMYSLPVNFRALPALTHCLNRLFACENWFQALGNSEEAGISFTPSMSQDDFQEGFRAENGPMVLYDPLDGGAVQGLFMESDCADRVVDMKREFASQTAATIRRLMDDPMRFVLKGKVQTLKPSDICILLRGRSDLEFLAQALRKEGVAFSFYRQPGLYQSEQAFHMRLLLDAVARPADPDAMTAVMLTPFFNLAPDEIAEGPAVKPARDLMLRAADLAVLRRWPAFFQMVLEETGILARLAMEGDERGQANLVQMAWELQQAAIMGNMDVHSLLRHLDLLRQREAGSGPDSGLHMLETERETVQIMTMHASKGLEFPVVFLYGGFTPLRDTSRHHTWFDPVLQRRVYDLAKSGGARHRRELEDGDRRLYYVACTRAVFRLFVPRISGQVKARLNGPVFSLVGTALSEIDMDACGLTWVSPHDRDGPVGLEEEVPDHFLAALAGLEANGACPGGLGTAQKPDFNPPHLPDLAGRSTVLHSYTSISKGYEARGHRPFFGSLFNDQADALQDEPYGRPGPVGLSTALPEQIGTPSGYSARGPGAVAGRADFELPPGAETGNLLHDILENIDYAQVAAATSFEALLEPGTSTAECIRTAMGRHRIQAFISSQSDCPAGQVEVAVAQMIFNTLRSRIPGIDLELASIPERDRRHELEFHVSIPGGSFVTGFIDLLFRVRSQGSQGHYSYYVLDWKSTSVGGGYSPEQIGLAMEEHNYHMQYFLYVWAVRRWFSMAGLDASSLCGVYYIFTRGMDPQVPGNGVYYRAFSESEAASFEDIVLQAVEKAEDAA